MSGSILSEESPLRSPAAWAPLDLAIVSAVGPDAVRFVDNFATASVSSLSVGQGTEAFFTDARGQVLALTTILRTAVGATILAAPGLGPMLRDHLERYHIRESLELTDISAEQASFLVAGADAAGQLEKLGSGELPQAEAEHGEHLLAGIPARVVRVTGRGADGFWLLVDHGRGDQLSAMLTAAGLSGFDPAVLEADRIEAGFPLPIDIVEKTLPQELGRDSRAISFTKGCYLGQETVARLDAMGHVNRRLAVVAIDGDRQSPLPSPLLLDGQPVGLITSAAVSARRGGTVGLAILQTRGLAGGPLRAGTATARVLSIPGHPELVHPG
jgi:folate-binding protein YgfZ